MLLLTIQFPPLEWKLHRDRHLLCFVHCFIQVPAACRYAVGVQEVSALWMNEWGHLRSSREVWAVAHWFHDRGCTNGGPCALEAADRLSVNTFLKDLL